METAALQYDVTRTRLCCKVSRVHVCPLLGIESISFRTFIDTFEPLAIHNNPFFQNQKQTHSPIFVQYRRHKGNPCLLSAILAASSFKSKPESPFKTSLNANSTPLLVHQSRGVTALRPSWIQSFDSQDPLYPPMAMNFSGWHVPFRVDQLALVLVQSSPLPLLVLVPIALDIDRLGRHVDFSHGRVRLICH